MCTSICTTAVSGLPTSPSMRIERLGLRDVAREAVEDETVGGVGLAEPLADHAEHDAVVDQLAGLHGVLRRDAERRAARDRRTQQIAGRNLRDAETLHETLGLRAFAGARRAKQNDSHDFRYPSLWFSGRDGPRSAFWHSTDTLLRRSNHRLATELLHEGQTCATQRLLRPVRWCHRRHQCLGRRRHRGGAQAPQAHRQGLCRPPRHRRRADRRPDRRRRRKPRHDQGAAPHPGRRVRLGALQAEGSRPEPRRVRAADRSLQGARHRLLLLQRRQRLDGHRATRSRRSARRSAIRITCIGVPKTVDNDLPLTDCCPGFGSVAKYIAVSTREAALDVASMARTSTKVFVLEVMGRHAGWIAAAGGLAGEGAGDAPHIILFPEIAFDEAAFLARVKQSVERAGLLRDRRVRRREVSGWQVPRRGRRRAMRSAMRSSAAWHR